jgi:pimeloyl-ACP methyl ester carboxylesterase
MSSRQYDPNQNRPSERVPVRSRKRRILLGVTAALAATVLGLSPLNAGAQPAPAGRPDAAVANKATLASSLAWHACRDGFDCATLKVPLDYERPNGTQIGLSVIRLPAASSRARIGSLFINPGGPGGSGVDAVRGVAKFLPLELRSGFDVVGFDPRGVARSTPLRCYDTFDEALQSLPPFAFPYTKEQERQQQAADLKLAAACVKHGGPILRHMSTADVARDMDSLRKAVGDRQLTYVGFSYGSFLGQTYANLFPSKVRALVIDGVLDPVAWTTGAGTQGRRVPVSTRLRSDVGAQATLQEFFRLCDQAGPDCLFSGGAAKRYAALAARIRQTPITIIDPETGDEFKFTYDQLIALTLGALYSPESWPDAAQLLADLEAQAAPQQLTRALAAVRASGGLAAAAQEPYPNIVESFPGVLCSDSTNPRKFSAWPAAADKAERQHGYFGRLWTWASSPCASWPRGVGDDRYQGPWRARTANPVLVVGNFFDPATPYHGALKAARLLPNSKLLSYAGWGHTAYFRGNFCVDNTVTTYLVKVQPPAKGKVCQPEGSPFGPDAVEATQSRAARAIADSQQGVLPLQRRPRR